MRLKNSSKEYLRLAKLFSNEPTMLFIVILLLIVVTWVALALPIVWLAGYARHSSGRIGDTFGILNSLFSALGFAALTYTLIQQNKTIKQQEQDTRVDRFESKFFQMLAAQREIVNELDLKRTVIRKKNRPGARIKRKVTTKGRECFKIMYNQHFVNFIFKAYEADHGRLDDYRKKDRNTYELLSLRHAVYVYEHKLFPMFQNDLSHYFRHLYHIVDMLDKATYIEDKTEYIGIVRAQMSMYEILLLFYNGLSRYGEKFKPLIEKHAVLKSIAGSYLMNGTQDIYGEIPGEIVASGYDLSAFGKGQQSPNVQSDANEEVDRKWTELTS